MDVLKSCYRFCALLLSKILFLYGGIFASFQAVSARCPELLDEPLRQVEGTRKRLAFSPFSVIRSELLGNTSGLGSHQQALEIARNAGDLPCEIANPP